MAPMDPSVLLKALSELLGPTGAIQGPDEATRIASLMKDATKIVSKCIYINILKLETPKETSEKLLSAGGWDILNDWLQSWKDEENFPLMIELLKVYQTLPVTVEILKKNNAAKTIKQLCKSDNDSVKTLATNIFDEWMKKVKGNNNNNTVNDESKSKKTKKDKDKDSKNSDNKSDSNSENKSKSRDSKHHSSSSHRDRDREKKSEHERNKDKTEEEMETSSNNSSVSEDAPTVRKGNGLKLTIKLGNDKDKERTQSSTKSDNKRGLKSDGTSSGSSDIIKRPSTVKIPTSKFRSIGLEEESVSSKASKPSPNDPNKVVPKRTGSDMKGDLTIKRPRLNMPPPPLSVPSPLVNTATTSGVTTPSTSSPTSPSEQHGKIKLIPARAKSNHAILESTGFMDSLTTTSRTYGAYKKKRRLSISGNGPGKVPSTPPSPLSPTTATAKSLPSVPSFYKDTQEDAKEPSPEKEEELKKERSPSPKDNLTNPGVEGELTNIDMKPETLDTTEVKRERSITPEFGKKAGFLESETKAESKGLLTAGGATKKKKKKKSVRWKEEKDLKEVFFFELDEDERENVNRPKDFKQAMKADIMCDRRAMETVRRLGHDNMNEQIIWYRPKLFPDVVEQDYGKDSEEKNVQRTREQGVLQAIFFNKTMLPDNPQEPDFEHQEHTDPKVIPIDDVSGGEECMYKHDEHPESIKNAPAAVNHAHDPQLHQLQQPPPQHQLPMGVGPPPPNLSLPPGLNLPPDLMNLLGQIQNGPQDPNNPVMTQVQLILNGLMSGNEQGYEQLQQIQHMMNSSMGLPPDALLQGPPPGMPPMGMPPQGPPMGPRTPLLGTAPPGYLPPRPMGPPPNRFGPGPPPGNWGQNMGGGPMGMPPHQGHKNRQQGGGYRGNRGRGRPQPIINNNHGAPRQKKILCRHFAQGMCRLGSNCNFLHTLPETDNKDKGHS